MNNSMDKKIVEDFEERIKRLEDIVKQFTVERHYIPKTPWEVPVSLNKCSKCGIKLDKVMCYTCSNLDCPCGLGPVVSSITTIY